MDENNNLAYLLTYVNYWPINFNSSQILAYFPHFLQNILYENSNWEGHLNISCETHFWYIYIYKIKNIWKHILEGMN